MQKTTWEEMFAYNEMAEDFHNVLTIPIMLFYYLLVCFFFLEMNIN